MRKERNHSLYLIRPQCNRMKNHQEKFRNQTNACESWGKKSWRNVKTFLGSNAKW